MSENIRETERHAPYIQFRYTYLGVTDIVCTCNKCYKTVTKRFLGVEDNYDNTLKAIVRSLDKETCEIDFANMVFVKHI